MGEIGSGNVDFWAEKWRFLVWIFGLLAEVGSETNSFEWSFGLRSGAFWSGSLGYLAEIGSGNE